MASALPSNDALLSDGALPVTKARLLLQDQDQRPKTNTLGKDHNRTLPQHLSWQDSTDITMMMMMMMMTS